MEDRARLERNLDSRGDDSPAVRYYEILQASSSPVRALLDQSVILVFCCTLFGAAAQVFLKLGATNIARPTPIQIITNVPLMAGYSLYGISTCLLILALRKGQLSILYPVISLTYVWVTILSMLIFKESLNLFKAVGLAIVIAGVAVLGRDSRT